MSNAALRFVEQISPAADSFLGPAEVVDVIGSDLEVSLPDGKVARAQMALAYPYEPAAGDVLLVIGKGEAHYVIGVLRGNGQATLAFQGNVALRAVGGSLSLEGDEGVEVRGPAVKVHAGRLETVANAAVQTFTSLCQRVSSLLSVHAGQSHTVVDGAAHTQAKTSTAVTEETMTFQGKTIHMF
jgi:hypothetical protein